MPALAGALVQCTRTDAASILPVVPMQLHTDDYHPGPPDRSKKGPPFQSLQKQTTNFDGGSIQQRYINDDIARACKLIG